MKIDRQSALWVGIMNGLLAGDRSADEDTIDTADRFYGFIIAREKEEATESINEPQKPEINDKSVNKELLDALEMVHAYLDQLDKDGRKLPNIEIIQGSNLSAIQMAKKECN